MKFVLAPDAFKESLTALQVAEAMAEGICRVFPNAEIIQVPMADGGEGTVQALVDASAGKTFTCKVTDPLRRGINAVAGLSSNGKTAFIETAAVSGLALLIHSERNPLLTTSRGIGELILAALVQGIEHLILGLGGSATNDGVQGLAAALGARFYDRHNRLITPCGGGSLTQIARIDLHQLDPRLSQITIDIASDVTSPLTGPQGASALFGPQKGASPEMVNTLEHHLTHYADCLRQATGQAVSHLAGSGAAGGIGATLLALTAGKLRPGIEIVIEYTRLKTQLCGAAALFIGEGAIDSQTPFGKTVYGVAQAAKQVNPDMPVIAVAGCINPGYETLYNQNIRAIFGILSKPGSTAAALKDGADNIRRTCENIARLLTLSPPG